MVGVPTVRAPKYQLPVANTSGVSTAAAGVATVITPMLASAATTVVATSRWMKRVVSIATPFPPCTWSNVLATGSVRLSFLWAGARVTF